MEERDNYSDQLFFFLVFQRKIKEEWEERQKKEKEEEERKKEKKLKQVTMKQKWILSTKTYPVLVVLPLLFTK